ncbi:MAG: class I SAM-dependent methyltransferase [Bacilli bacterium]|nr:class I SAM-dependent methyltransferase [Bacilli bacterium]
MKISEKNKIAIDTYDLIAEKYKMEFENDLSDQIYIDKFLEYVKTGTILDIGCGIGHLTNYISQKGFQITGIDLSTHMLEIARQSYPNIEFLKMNMRDLQFDSNYFTGIFAAYSLFHLPLEEMKQVLATCKRILKEKGFIILFLQEGTGDHVIREPLLPEKNTYIQYIEEFEIVHMLGEAGFHILCSAKKNIKEAMGLGENTLILIASSQ